MLLDLFTGKKREPAECIIRIDGEEITHLYGCLVEVSVNAGRLNGAEGTMRFESRRDEKGAWLVQDDPAIHPWAEIEVLVKFGDVEEEVLRGYLKKVTSEYPSEAGSASVTVSFQDASILMDRHHRRMVWGGDSPTTDQAILEEMLGGTGVTLHAESEGQDGLVLQQNSTDIRFLRTRAQGIGYELIFREGELYFGPMRLEGEPQSTILVYAGPDTNCIHFSIDDDGHLPDQVIFDVAAETGSDAVERTLEPDLPLLGNEPATSTGAGLPDFAWRLDREGLSTETDLATTAQARANENSMKVKVSGQLDGSLYGHVLRVGETVGVDGVGERHNGVYYVDQVTHVFDGTGYRQSFRLLRNAYGDNLGGVSDHPLAAL